MSIVVVTELEYNKAEEIFSTAKDFECIPVSKCEEEIAKTIRSSNASHAIIGVDKYTNLLYQALPRGGVIARFGVGHDGIDKQQATKAGIFCTNTPVVLNESVAEVTITLILAAARKIVTQAANCRAGIWEPVTGIELRNKILTIVGCGPIGRRAAQIAAMGFQMRVIGCEKLDVDLEQMKKRIWIYDYYKGF